MLLDGHKGMSSMQGMQSVFLRRVMVSVSNLIGIKIFKVSPLLAGGTTSVAVTISKLYILSVVIYFHRTVVSVAIMMAAMLW